MNTAEPTIPDIPTQTLEPPGRCLHKEIDARWCRPCIGEATPTIETTKERWCEAEVSAWPAKSRCRRQTPYAAKAEPYFDRALAVARRQQAKSWELRAAMSMARFP